MVDPAFPPPKKKNQLFLDLGDFALHFDLTFFGLWRFFVVMVTSLIMTHLKFERSPLKRDYPIPKKGKDRLANIAFFRGYGSF